MSDPNQPESYGIDTLGVRAGCLHQGLIGGPVWRQPGLDQPEVARHREQEQRQAERDSDD